MDFCKTETYQCLARSFAGESQAGMRYQLIAKQANAMGFKILADAIKDIAKNETYHAKAFYDKLTAHIDGEKKIRLNSDYPFWFGTLEENLRHAADGEKEEHEFIYRDFGSIAKAEGFSDIASLYFRIAEIEKNHEIVFTYLANAVKEGKLYKHDHPSVWICSECGYMHTAEEAWKVCPVCGRPQGEVYLHLPFQGEEK